MTQRTAATQRTKYVLLYLQSAPMKHAEYCEQVIKRQIRLMHERGIWVEPER